MSVTDRDRRDIYEGLEEFLGESVANNLMSLLPFQPADELATRTDVLAMGSQLQGEMAELRGEVRGDIAKLDARMTAQGGQIRNEIANLRNHTTRLMVGGVATNAVAIFAALAV